MSNDNKNLTRRDFLELAAAGAAGVAISGLGASPLLAAPRRGGDGHVWNAVDDPVTRSPSILRRLG